MIYSLRSEIDQKKCEVIMERKVTNDKKVKASGKSKNGVRYLKNNQEIGSTGVMSEIKKKRRKMKKGTKTILFLTGLMLALIGIIIYVIQSGKAFETLP